MSDFNAARLELARRRRSLTQKDVASRAGISARSLRSFERGLSVPSAASVAKLAHALDFPQEFFMRPEPVEVGAEAASFRALSSMSARQRHAVLAAGALATDINEWLEARFDLPVTDLPVDIGDETPSAAAAALRAHWGLGERPIANMVHLLEARGIRVFSLTEDCVSVDAFSIWLHDVPFVFLNMLKSGERGRFDAAHELGHLVLHHHGGPSGRAAEDQANAFASAFLMPEASMRAMAPRVPSLAALTPIKKRWKVSLAATLRRFYELGLFSQWHYDRLNIEIAKRGGRRKELGGAMPREGSQLLRKVFLTLREEGVRRAELAQELAFPTEELEALIFGLVLDQVEGGKRGRSMARATADLRLVEQ